jgi:hypothetical protein
MTKQQLVDRTVRRRVLQKMGAERMQQYERGDIEFVTVRHLMDESRLPRYICPGWRLVQEDSHPHFYMDDTKIRLIPRCEIHQNVDNAYHYLSARVMRYLLENPTAIPAAWYERSTFAQPKRIVFAGSLYKMEMQSSEDIHASMVYAAGAWHVVPIRIGWEPGKDEYVAIYMR